MTPLTAYSSDPLTAYEFTHDDDYADRPEVMVVVRPGSKATAGWPHGGVTRYETHTGWVRDGYAPVEHVS